MSETVQIAIVTALLNAAVTWGVISTKLAWLRRDIDTLFERIQGLEAMDRRRHERRHVTEDTE